MIKVETSPSTLDAASTSSLASLSRNASVISTSSSDSGPSIHVTPRPRPIRTFSSPRTNSPHSVSPRQSRPPSYLTRDLGLANDTQKDGSPLTAKPRSKSRGRNVGIDDFKMSETLGEGSYSTVIRATYIPNGKQFAIKVLDKGHLVRKQKMSVALVEKTALLRLAGGHPGIIRLHYAFHDEWSLYFVLDLAHNGEIQTVLSQIGSLSTTATQYYTAQIIDAVAYMHNKGVIHRDLKPENLLLDDAFRIKIADFGTAKIFESDLEVEKFVGTAQYVAPELVESNITSKSSDLWAIGCIVYQMIAGRFAFHGLSEYITLQKVKRMDYTFPDGFDEHAKDLVERLLVRDPDQRLGAGPEGGDSDMAALRAHPFLASIKWDTLWTDPAPPLEAGLLKKEPPPPEEAIGNWEDVGAAWDKLVLGDEQPGEDGLQWASDTERGGSSEYSHEPSANGAHVQTKDAEIGPMGEIRTMSTSQPILVRTRPSDEAVPEPTHGGSPSNSSNGGGSPVISPPSQPILVRTAPVEDAALHESVFAGSPSSEGGSPVERRLASAVRQMKSFSFRHTSPERSVPSESLLEEQERGRDQAMTPVQGNGPPVDLSSVLNLPDGETILYSSTVEARSLRRRASRLLPLKVPPTKPKTRELILTNRRLFCLKHRGKLPEDITVKEELFLRAEKVESKEKEKESRVLTTVELKGEREFVVFTSTKTYSYATPDAAMTSVWVQKIDDALTHGKQTNVSENMDILK